MVPIPSRDRASKTTATRCGEGGESFSSFSSSSPKKFGRIFGKVIDGKTNEVLLRPPCTEHRSKERRAGHAGDEKRFFSSKKFLKFCEEIFGKSIDGRAIEVLVQPSQHEEPNESQL